MNTIAAQELKLGGIAAIKRLLKDCHELIVQERGKDACIIVDLEYFNQLKLCELDVAYLKAQEDIKNGKFTSSIDNYQKHVDTILQEIDDEDNLTANG